MSVDYEPLSEAEQAKVDKAWEEVWKDLVMVDGELSLDRVKRELSDYWQLIDTASQINYHVTGGELSKVNYTPDVIISLADEHYRKLYEEDDE